MIGCTDPSPLVQVLPPDSIGWLRCEGPSAVVLLQVWMSSAAFKTGQWLVVGLLPLSVVVNTMYSIQVVSLLSVASVGLSTVPGTSPVF